MYAAPPNVGPGVSDWMKSFHVDSRVSMSAGKVMPMLWAA